MPPRLLLAVIATFGLSGVVLGAFAAHGLAEQLSATRLGQWQTAVSYQFVHTLALALLYVVPASPSQKRCAALCWVVGVLLFSGSLYLLVLLDQSRLGMVTPFGGLAFIAGWATLIYAALRGQNSEQ